MLDLKEIYEEAKVIAESKSKRLYENGKLTFAELRDIINGVFSDGGTVLQKKVPGINLLITYKNGEFCISTDLKALEKPCSFSKFNDKCCEAGKDVKVSFMNSIKDLIEALNALDPVLLNKYFANGQNFMDCQIVYPPEECCGNYGNKCFISFNKLKCYDKNFKEVGEDSESALELFDALKQNSALCQEVSEISAPNIEKLRGCKSGKKILDTLMPKLQALIDGVGWGCSIDSYIQDKYSRYVINKALEHGLDVSRNSAFVNELVARLSGAKLRPTKSDLVCFAKREGLNCNSDEYKSFLSDIEANANEMSSEIVAPIENVIWYAIAMALKNILGYMAIDPNAKTQKFLDGIDYDCCSIEEDENGESKWCNDKLEPLRKTLSKVNQYIENLPPSGVVIMYKTTPYKVVSKLGKIDSLCKLIGC